MNRKSGVALIVGIAMVGVLALAVWAEKNLGPPRLTALAGMKPDFQFTMQGIPSDMYVLKSGKSVVRKSIEEDLKSHGFKYQDSSAEVSQWRRNGWVIYLIEEKPSRLHRGA